MLCIIYFTGYAMKKDIVINEINEYNLDNKVFMPTKCLFTESIVAKNLIILLIQSKWQMHNNHDSHQKTFIMYQNL